MTSIKVWRFYLLCVILALAALFVHTRSEVAVPINHPLNQLPLSAGTWVMNNEVHFSEQILEVLKPTDYLYRSYTDSKGNQVSLYLGFHDGGPNSGPIHSPKQCLPGSGWNRLHEEVRSVEVAGQKIPYVSAVYQKDQEMQLFIYWFQVRNEILTNEYALKREMVKNSLLLNRRDSAFIRLSVMMTGDETLALETGEQFMRDFVPLINAMLPI